MEYKETIGLIIGMMVFIFIALLYRREHLKDELDNWDDFSY